MAKTNLPTGTVTFLFTDIEGSTRLWQEHPDAMAPVLARHDALLRQAIEHNGGHVFKTMGDAFLAVFQNCRAATEAAIAGQRALRAEPWSNVPAIKVRMALHTGEADEREGDYFGQPLNRCARLLSAAHGGQILLSHATAGLAREAMPVGASLKDLGEHRLRDLIRAERIHQLVHPDLPSEFPSLRGLQSFPNNLPVQTTSFVGRQQEMADVKILLAASRLVTLKAMGGCGKTRLALQIAADALEEFPDGVWLVELAALTDGALVTQAVATALGVKEEPGRPLGDTLLDRLRGGRLLLLLDNCEHLVEDCARLADAVIRQCPKVNILATSREALGVAGETVWHVPSLSVPAADDGAALDSEAVRLFVERARAAQPRFALTVENAAPVVQICRQLEGIPLAIELAAARVKMLSASEIAARLSDRFRLLTGGPRTADRRQQTLQALIDWSYVLLSPEEQRLFRQLSAFVGGWTLETAEALADGDVFDLLTRLVDKSLVLAEEQRDRMRYRFLETVRQYAWAKASEAGEIAGLGQRRLEIFLALAEQAEPHLTGAEQQPWFDRLETEHDNLRAALMDSQTDTGGSGLRLAGALWRFWLTRGYFTEGRMWLEAVARARSDATRALRAKALKAAGALATQQADYTAAQALYQQALALFRELDDKLGTAYTLNNLGDVAHEQSNFAEARRLLEQSLTMLRELGADAFSVAAVLSNLGRAAREQNDYATARALLDESLTLRRQLGDRHGIALSLFNLGLVAREQCDYPRATALLNEALEIQRSLGSKRDEAWTLCALAEAALLEGGYSQARAWNEESLKLFRTVGDQRGIASALNGLGDVHCRSGDPATGASLYEQSLQIFRQLSDRAGIAAALDALGTAALKGGDLAMARRLFSNCLEINLAIANRRWTARSFETFAALSLAEDDPRRAARLLGAASAIREAIGAPLSPNERTEYEKQLAETRTRLGEPQFASSYAEGRAMSIEQASASAVQPPVN